MPPSPIYEPGFRPQFSGHETFPLRYGWLKKAYDAIEANSGKPDARSPFLADEAIAQFGVGKNMVTSMRYWGLAARTIADESNGNLKGPFRTTRFGDAFFGDRGWDQYLEDPASLWWLHWQFAANPKPTTTVYFVFNHFNATSFYRDQLVGELKRYSQDIGCRELANLTLRRDVECFVRTYVARTGDTEEESLESLMSELALIQPIGKRDGFVLSRGPKATLPDAIFYYGLTEFARSRNGIRSFSVETLAHEPGSPGRVFLLSEDALLERLSRIDEISEGVASWSETAGLRQVLFQENPSSLDAMKIVARAFRPRRQSVGRW